LKAARSALPSTRSARHRKGKWREEATTQRPGEKVKTKVASFDRFLKKKLFVIFFFQILFRLARVPFSLSLSLSLHLLLFFFPLLLFLFLFLLLNASFFLQNRFTEFFFYRFFVLRSDTSRTMSETRFELDWQMEFLNSLGFLGLGGHLLQVRRRRVSAARRRRPARRTPPPTFTFYGPGFLHPPAKSGGFRRPLSRQPSLFRSMKPIPGSLSLSLSLSLSFVSIFPLKITSKPQRTLVDVANRKEFLHFV